MSKNFIFNRTDKSEWFDKNGKLNKTIFDILQKAKKEDKNILVHIAEVDDKQAKELERFY